MGTIDINATISQGDAIKGVHHARYQGVEVNQLFIAQHQKEKENEKRR